MWLTDGLKTPILLLPAAARSSNFIWQVACRTDPALLIVQLLPARPVESSSGDSCNVRLQWALLGTDRTCSSSSQTCASDTRWVHACSPRTWQGVGKVICHLLRESPYGQSAVPLQCLLPQLTGDGSHDSAGRSQQR